MNKTIVKCAILGGIVVFVWGLVSWMILPWHKMSIHKFDNESAVARAIQQNTPVSGLYLLPNFYTIEKPSSDSKEERRAQMQNSGDESSKVEKQIQKTKEYVTDKMSAAKEAMRAGPFVYCMVRKEGMDPDSVAPFVLSLIVQMVAAGFITWLLMMTKAMTYMKQVTFVTTIGLVGGLIAVFPQWVWVGFPFGFAVMGTINLMIAWFLGGLVIAKLFRR